MYAYLVRSFAHIRKSLRIFAYWPYAIRSGGLYNGTLRTSNFLLLSLPKNVNAAISARSCLLSYDNFHDLQMTCPLNVYYGGNEHDLALIYRASALLAGEGLVHTGLSLQSKSSGDSLKKVIIISLNNFFFLLISSFIKTVRKILTRICPNKINLYINHMYMFMRYTVASY